MTADRLVPVRVVAERLGVSDETVYRRARAGKLAYVRDEDTGTWRFSWASVEAYVRERLTPAIPARQAQGNGSPRRLHATAPTADEPWRGSIFGRRRARQKEGTHVTPLDRETSASDARAAAGHRAETAGAVPTRALSAKSARSPRPTPRPTRGHKEAV